MNHSSDPFGAFAQMLVDLFGRHVSPTLMLDVFAGLCVIGIAAAFIHNFRNIPRNDYDDDDDDDDEEP